MLEHVATVRAREISCEPRSIVQHGVNSDSVRLSLDGEWASLERVTLVMSKGGLSTAVPYEGDPVPVPFELMEEVGPLYLTVVGRSGDDVRVVTERMALPCAVVESGAVDGTYEPGDPVLDEVQAAIADARDAAGEAREAAARCNTITLGAGPPESGGVVGDLYIDSDDYRLYRLEDTNG